MDGPEFVFLSRHEIEVFDCYSRETRARRRQNDFCAKNHHWNPRERKRSYHLIIMSDHHLVAGGRTSSLIKSRHFSHFHQGGVKRGAEEAVGGHSNGLVVGHQAE